MRVAIWGSYKHGNFGDDLMAVLFARRAAAAGADPVVLELDPALARRVGIERASSVDELLDGADLCLMGGGAMLESGVLRWGARAYSRDLEADLVKLWRGARGRLPIHALSIGGSGRTTPWRLSPAKALLYRSGVVERATVRLPDDVEVLSRCGVPTEHHPDVLLRADRWFRGAGDPRGERLRVGVNLNRRTGGALASAVVDRARTRDDLEVVFFHSHLPGHGQDYELLPPQEGRISHHHYEDPDETTAALAALDLLVSSKLHLGVTALSFGVPFLSYAGKAKTAAFLRSIDAGHHRFVPGDEARLLAVIDGAATQLRAGRDPRPDLLPAALDAQRRASVGHEHSLDAALGVATQPGEATR